MREGGREGGEDERGPERRERKRWVAQVGNLCTCMHTEKGSMALSRK